MADGFIIALAHYITQNYTTVLCNTSTSMIHHTPWYREPPASCAPTCSLLGRLGGHMSEEHRLTPRYGVEAADAEGNEV